MEKVGKVGFWWLVERWNWDGWLVQLVVGLVGFWMVLKDGKT